MLFQLVNILFSIAQYLILARVIISWLPNIRYHPVSRWIVGVVDPALRPLQRLLPPWKTGGLDFSPILAFILLYIARIIVLRILAGMPI